MSDIIISSTISEEYILSRVGKRGVSGVTYPWRQGNWGLGVRFHGAYGSPNEGEGKISKPGILRGLVGNKINGSYKRF